MKRKSYSELMTISSFEERIKYLMLNGAVGAETFGPDRVFNQVLYRSYRWKKVRDRIIVRDNGCDLGFAGQEILGEPIIIHHINPITIDDLRNESEELFDEENLISTRKLTHNIIHYGYAPAKPITYRERTPNDTCPWKNKGG